MNAYIPFTGDIIEKLTHFTRSSPAKRIFQIQDIFKDLLKNIEDTIYIVAEDTDRSGDAGIYFIETLNQFLKDLDVDNKIKVFVPIAKETFTNNQNMYIKALDYIEFFEFGKRDFEKFVDIVFAPNLTMLSTVRENMIEIIQGLSKENRMTIRQLKLIIRSSEARYRALQKQGLSPDPQIILLMQASKFYHEVQIDGTNKIAHAMFMARNSTEGSNFANEIIYAIANRIVFSEAKKKINDYQIKPKDLVCHFTSEEIVHAITKTAIPFHKHGRQYLPEYYLI